MAIEVCVPTLGESIVEATISKWLKQVGDTVGAGEPLVELETDKVNLEVPADEDGVLALIAKTEGETVRIGDILCVLDSAVAEKTDTGKPEAEASSRASAPLQPEQAAGESQPEGTQAEKIPAARMGEGDVYATPVAQRVAAEHALDIGGVRGSGPGGRVTKDDVLEHIRQVSGDTPTSPATPSVSPTINSIASASSSSLPSDVVLGIAQESRREERVRMSRRRQTIARRLVEAQHNAAMLTTFNEINMSGVVAMRQRHKERFQERYAVGLGFMSFFVKATIGALKVFPFLNAEIQGEEVVLKHYYDIGVAVGTDQGLVVPVLRNADGMTCAEVEKGIADLARRSRENTLTLEELRGGTFSITNGGIYGSLMSTPILNTPQVGILGMHKIEERPVAVHGEIVIQPMMYVALSYDHRIVDGSDAVRFLVRVKEMIEDPEKLLLEG